VKNNIYACIELGSSEVRLLVCNIKEERLYVLSQKSIPSKGITRGNITDVKKITEQVKKLKAEVELDLKQPLKQVLLTVPTIDSQIETVAGKIDLDINKPITSANVRGLFRSIINQPTEGNYIAVNIIPRMFRVDGQNAVQNPRGLTGSRLGIDAQKVLVPVPIVSNLVYVVESAGFKISDIFMGSIAETLYILNSPELLKRTCHINIGHHVTTITIVNDGKIVLAQSLGVGGHDITKAIAERFLISEELAGKLKDDFGRVNYSEAEKDQEVIYVDEGEDRSTYMTRQALCEVVTERSEMIFKVIKDYLNESIYLQKGDFHYALTGGTSEIPGMTNVLNRHLGEHVSLHRPSMLGVRHAKYCKLVGMAIFAHEIALLIGQKKNNVDIDFYGGAEAITSENSVAKPANLKIHKPQDFNVFSDDIEKPASEAKPITPVPADKKDEYIDYKLENSGVLVRLFDMIFNENEEPQNEES